MTVVAFEELHAVHDPRVEAGTDVLEHLAHEMLAVAQPRQLSARRCQPNGFLALLALIPDVHALLAGGFEALGQQPGMSDGRSATGAPIAWTL